MFWNQYMVATFDLILNYFAVSLPPPPPPHLPLFTPCQSVIYYNQVRKAPAPLEAIYVGNKMNAYVVIPVLCRYGVILTLGRWGWRGSDSASCRSYTAHIVSCRSYTAHIASYLSYDAHIARESQGWSIITAHNSSLTLCTKRENIIKDKALNDIYAQQQTNLFISIPIQFFLNSTVSHKRRERCQGSFWKFNHFHIRPAL